ncbi:MAG: molybdopterin oxidoreductase, partial [Bacteroidota bacterium]
LLGAIGNFDKDTQIPDDLKKVKGIGPLMEKTLNKIGIFSFLQVSKMTENEYNLLDSITGSFPGRAQRDDWAGQAKTLINLDK